jgi:hypothetical protein
MRTPYLIKIPPGLKTWEADNWRAVANIAQLQTNLDDKVNSSVGVLASTGKIKVSSGDLVADYLYGKLYAGTGVSLSKSITGGAGAEIITITAHVPVTLAADHGLALTGQVLAMGTPSTCTDATTNAVSGTTHTHEITFPGAGDYEPALGNPAANDYVLSSQTDGTRSWVEMTGGAGTGIPADGWVVVADTFTYASATTFTVPTDLTGIYRKGTKIKLTQTTIKYFVVTGSSYSAPDTTVIITAGTDYTLANAAITSPNYSHIENPSGYPDWFNYTPSMSASGSMTVGGVSITLAAFSVKDEAVFVVTTIDMTLAGTTSNTIYATLPIDAKTGCGANAASVLHGGVAYTGFSSITVATTPDTLGFRSYNSGNLTLGACQIKATATYWMV